MERLIGWGSKEDLRVEPLRPEQVFQFRRGVERSLQHRRRNRLPHRRSPRQVAEDRAAQNTQAKIECSTRSAGEADKQIHTMTMGVQCGLLTWGW
jgi:hypothetical protein